MDQIVVVKFCAAEATFGFSPAGRSQNSFAFGMAVPVLVLPVGSARSGTAPPIFSAAEILISVAEQLVWKVETIMSALEKSVSGPQLIVSMPEMIASRVSIIEGDPEIIVSGPPITESGSGIVVGVFPMNIW